MATNGTPLGTVEAERSPIALSPAALALLSRLPKHVRSTLSAVQIEAIICAVHGDRTRHMVDLRLSVPVLSRRYYVTFLLGRERRTWQRLLQEGQLDARLISALFALISVTLLGLAVMGAILAMYLVKSALGIDLFTGASVLHDLVY